jgi:hypothetical protein
LTSRKLQRSNSFGRSAAEVIDAPGLTSVTLARPGIREARNRLNEVNASIALAESQSGGRQTFSELGRWRAIAEKGVKMPPSNPDLGGEYRRSRKIALI